MFGESTLLNVLGGGTISSSDGNSNSYSGVGIFLISGSPGFHVEIPGKRKTYRKSGYRTLDGIFS